MIANIFNAIKDFFIDLIPGLSELLDTVKASTGIDLKEAKLNSAWVKKVLGVVGFDLVHSCYIAYSEYSETATLLMHFYN